MQRCLSLNLFKSPFSAFSARIIHGRVRFPSLLDGYRLLFIVSSNKRSYSYGLHEGFRNVQFDIFQHLFRLTFKDKRGDIVSAFHGSVHLYFRPRL